MSRLWTPPSRLTNLGHPALARASVPGPSTDIAEVGPFRLRPPTWQDAILVAADLRPSDRGDLAATTPETAETIILRNLQPQRRSFAIDYQHRCVAVCGFVDQLRPGMSVIWLLGTPGFDEALLAGGWRLCRRWIPLMAGPRTSLFNIVPESSARTLRWLEWLGFRRVARHTNFRALGQTCVEVHLSLAPPAMENVA